MNPSRLALGTALLAASLAAAAETRLIESPADRVTLVELFTSEGCSSCPPADRWLSRLVDDPRLWHRLVPVAFHVDYWDYIGWPDRFADPRFSERQRNHARRGVLRSVYTPGFVVHGEEWRAWFRRPRLELGTPPPAGVLRLEVSADTGLVRITYTAAQALDGTLDVHLAVLGFGLETPVDAGENAGRTLRHDFVALGYSRSALSGRSPSFHAEAPLPAAPGATGRRALAAWVARSDETRPIQAAGGWLP